MNRTANADTRRLIVAIDGPSGAGKSTITRLLSQRLGYLNIDTGAMFRTLALAVARAGVSPDDEAALTRICAEVSIELHQTANGLRVLSNGEDVTAAIRTPEISLLTSQISAKKPVRDILLTLQRNLGQGGGVVLEGRDVGTVVFPDADVKFFLTASAEERGRRRHLELASRGEQVGLEETIDAVRRRDFQDENREHAPLRRAEDAVLIDATNLTVEQVLEQMTRVIDHATARKKLRGEQP